MRDPLWLLLIEVVFGGVSAHYFAYYLQIAPLPLVRGVILVLYIVSAEFLRKNKEIKKAHVIVWAMFALVLTLNIILGFHISVGDKSDQISQGYISAFTANDLLAFVFILPTVFCLLISLYLFINSFVSTKSVSLDKRSKPISLKKVLLFAAALFLLWLPYLLTYWPGLILGDSTDSIQQGLGNVPLNNHHPVIYSLFTGVCQRISQLFGGGITEGIAIYSVIQMLYMAVCLSFLINWIERRSGIKPIWGYLLCAVFGLSPHIAAFSIALWKDPIFSSTLCVISVLLAEFCFTRGEVAKKKLWLTAYVFLLLVAIFSRNNGIYIIFFTTVVLLIIWGIYDRFAKRSVCVKMIIASASVILFSLIVTGPIYNIFSVQKEKVESVGVFLNQMARVVVYDGEMSDEDREYMNSLLALEQYSQAYTPSCVDSLKWDENFNSKPLDNDFFKHYFSMLQKNPKIYFDSWVLETYGFWTINRPEVNTTWSNSNISMGVQRNTDSEKAAVLEDAGIYVKNIFGAEEAREIFVTDEWSIPLGYIFLGICFLSVSLLLNKQGKLLLCLSPSIGLFITLIVATPIFYWVRYGISAQFLIPFYLLLPFAFPNNESATIQIGKKTEKDT